jgi:hypothetical protein
MSKLATRIAEIVTNSDRYELGNVVATPAELREMRNAMTARPAKPAKLRLCAISATHGPATYKVGRYHVCSVCERHAREQRNRLVAHNEPLSRFLP